MDAAMVGGTYRRQDHAQRAADYLHGLQPSQVSPDREEEQAAA